MVGRVPGSRGAVDGAARLPILRDPRRENRPLSSLCQPEEAVKIVAYAGSRPVAILARAAASAASRAARHGVWLAGSIPLYRPFEYESWLMVIALRLAGGRLRPGRPWAKRMTEDLYAEAVYVPPEDSQIAVANARELALPPRPARKVPWAVVGAIEWLVNERGKTPREVAEFLGVSMEWLSRTLEDSGLAFGCDPLSGRWLVWPRAT